jgi:hypothetical protein
MKEHFEISRGYEFSVGMQFGGGVKKYQAAYLNLGSTVVSELNISNKKERLLGNMYEPYEKNNYGFLASYLGGIEYKQEVVNYSKVHNIDIGIYTFGGQLVFDKDWSLVDWFVGWDPSVKGAFGIGFEGNFRLGFSK